MISGHCLFPATEVKNSDGSVTPVEPEYSHGNCALPGCDCGCHLGEEFECANCERPLREAPHLPNEDEPGEMVYVHIDKQTGRAIGEECVA